MRSSLLIACSLTLALAAREPIGVYDSQQGVAMKPQEGRIWNMEFQNNLQRNNIIIKCEYLTPTGNLKAPSGLMPAPKDGKPGYLRFSGVDVTAGIRVRILTREIAEDVPQAYYDIKPNSQRKVILVRIDYKKKFVIEPQSYGFFRSESDSGIPVKGNVIQAEIEG